MDEAGNARSSDISVCSSALEKKCVHLTFQCVHLPFQLSMLSVCVCVCALCAQCAQCVHMTFPVFLSGISALTFQRFYLTFQS